MALISKRLLSTVPTGLGSFSTKSASATLGEQARSAGDKTFDVFLSHSYADAKSVGEDDLLRLKRLLEQLGLMVYVDWVDDSGLSREHVTPATAAVLRGRMNQCRSLLYVTSENASKSRWMPWELGYFDGRNGRAAVLPIDDSVSEKTSYNGQEFLGLYPFITYSKDSNGQYYLWVQEKDGKFVILQRWIKGENPTSNH